MTSTADDPSGADQVRRPPVLPGARVTRLAPTHTADRVPLAPVEGSLALRLDTPRGMPTTPELRLVRGAASQQVHGFAARFAQAVVEVLGGDRSVTQLLRWTNESVYLDLTRRAHLLRRRQQRRLRGTLRPQVRSVHVSCPTQTTAEVSVHVRHGQRSRAIAARLEHEEGRWRCTALQLG